VAGGSFRWVSFKNNQANTRLYMYTIAEKLFGLQELKRQTNYSANMQLQTDRKTNYYNFYAVKTLLRKADPAEYHCGYYYCYCLRLLWLPVEKNSPESCSSALRHSGFLFQSFFVAISVTSVVCRLAKLGPFFGRGRTSFRRSLSFASLKLRIRSDFVDP